ncbi:hypothetical protein ACRYCC_32205 [Actinomadura scrupuli]|uniref:hypothetical protein n=1 Tax=Actinomadura scrupuli TaxID=559629 RepID=UPI003D95CFDC
MSENPEELVFVDPELPEQTRKKLLAELTGKGRPTRERDNGAGCVLGVLSGVICGVTLSASGVDHWLLVSGLVAMFVNVIAGTKMVRPVEPDHQNAYVRARDLDQPSLDLMTRAVEAVAVVTGSRVSREGLLDEVANEVVLPRQLWEIARVLLRQTELRTDQAEAENSLMTEELAAVLRPQREALLHSVGVITGRVEGLETYAQRVRAADSALEARDRLENNDKYYELLAHTDDEAAMASLGTQAVEIEETLRANLTKALAAGEALALPSTEAADS